MTKDRRLGRGLAALLGTPVEGDDSFASEPRNVQPTRGPANRLADSTAGSVASFRISADQAGAGASTSNLGYVDLDVTLIDANPFQPRRIFNSDEIESLAESIKAHKQLQPILVRKNGSRFQLISGERRLRATVHAGLPSIKAEVREADDRLMAEISIVENLQRKDLNAVEKAMSFKRYLTEHRCTQEELAGRLKIDRSTIANMLRLLELPDPILEAVQKEEISAGHAKAILSLGSEDEQQDFVVSIRREGWSVRETERRVAERIASEEAAESGVVGVASTAKAKTKSDQVASLEQDLKRQLGTKVEIRQAARGRGKIVIHFNSPEEFDRIRSLFDSPLNQHSKVA